MDRNRCRCRRSDRVAGADHDGTVSCGCCTTDSDGCCRCCAPAAVESSDCTDGSDWIAFSGGLTKNKERDRDDIEMSVSLLFGGMVLYHISLSKIMNSIRE